MLFKTLVKTCVTHTSGQIAHEGLVYVSLDRVWESSCVLLQEVQIETRNWLDSTRNDPSYIDMKNVQLYRK